MKKKLLLSLILLTSSLTLVTSCGENPSGDNTDVTEEGTVVISQITNGTIEASALKGKVGDKIILTFTPSTGYKLESATCNDVAITVANNKGEITLVKGNNLVKATFVEDKKIEDEVPTNFNADISFTGIKKSTTSFKNGTFSSSLLVCTDSTLNPTVSNVENVYGDENNSLKFSSSSKKGALTFTFAKQISLDRITLKVSIYNEDTPSVAVTFGSKKVEKVVEEGELLLDLGESIKSDTLTIASVKSSRNRFFLSSINLHGGEDVVIPVTGIELTSTEPKTAKKNQSIDLASMFKVLPLEATNKNFVLSCTDANLTITGTKVKSSIPATYEVVATTVDGNFTAKVNVTVTNEEIVDGDGTEKISKNDLRYNYYDVMTKADNTMSVIPSKGTSNILVVPVNFSDLTTKWDGDRLTSLNGALNGTKTDGTNDYWESLASYYKKSSYGIATPTYTICETITPTMSASSFVGITDDYGTESLTLIDEIYSKMVVNGAPVKDNVSKYDSDSDGYIDGVWFIYNEFDLTTVNSSRFWAYTYWYYEDSQRATSLKDCKINCFANMAGAFNYEESELGLDAHTLIHETGHMFGLDDYYSYDQDVSTSALGGLDMMDMNVGDHNAFSKMSLGWVDPSILKGEGKLTLKPFENDGDCLVVPSGYFNNGAFSEYYIIQYYTPNGLNSLDSTNRYSTRDLLYSQNGLLIYHIDARLGKLVYDYNTGSSTFKNVYLDTTLATIPDAVDTATTSTYYNVIASNTYSSSKNKNALIGLVDRKNDKVYNKHSGSNSSLWVKGDIINKTTTSTYLNSGKWYEGSEFTYSITVDEMTDEGATLSFTK